MIKRYIQRDTLLSILGNIPKNKELSENIIHNYFIQYGRTEEIFKEENKQEKTEEDEVIETDETET